MAFVQQRLAILILCCLGLSLVAQAQTEEGEEIVITSPSPDEDTPIEEPAEEPAEETVVITAPDAEDAPIAEIGAPDDEDGVDAVEEIRTAPMEYMIGGDIGWTVQTYEDITDAIVGDILVFVYQPFHTVWEVPERACNFEEGTELAGLTDSPFKLELEEPGTIHISDNTEGRCEAGKLFSVVVSEVP